jgi:hypothetical protein
MNCCIREVEIREDKGQIAKTRALLHISKGWRLTKTRGCCTLAEGGRGRWPHGFTDRRVRAAGTEIAQPAPEREVEILRRAAASFAKDFSSR